MQTRTSIFFALLFLLLSPSVAHASDFGLIAVYAFLTLVTILCAIINAIVTIRLLVKQKYKRKNFLFYYTCISHFVIAGFIILVSGYEWIGIFFCVTYAVIFIGLPIVQYRKYSNKSEDA